MEPRVKLFEAIAAGDADAVRRLVEADPGLASTRDETGISPILHARYRMRQDILEILLAADPPLDLFEAAALGGDDRVSSILDAEPSAVTAWSADGFTALHLAAFFGHQETVALLIRRGADPAIPARNPSRVTPLHSSAASRRVAPVRVLLAAGAPPDARQHGGYTALHAAARHGLDEMASVLVAAGADPEVRDDQGKTAVDHARENGHATLAARLAGP